MTPLAHIVSVIAIWTMMLFGLRFAINAGEWLVPIGRAGWHLMRCEGNRRICFREFRHAVDRLHIDLAASITSPWSAVLLFGGSALIGLAYAFGSAGDAVRLVSDSPEQWQAFDVATDCIAAMLSVAGMSFVLASSSRRRTASFLVSFVLALTGAGIAMVTL